MVVGDGAKAVDRAAAPLASASWEGLGRGAVRSGEDFALRPSPQVGSVRTPPQDTRCDGQPPASASGRPSCRQPRLMVQLAGTQTYKEPWTATIWDNVGLLSLQLASAGGSGAIAKTAVAPLERIKILLQVQGISSLPGEEKYRGLRDALWRLPQREGYLAFYRGNGTNVLRLLPEVSLKYAINDQLKVLFAPQDGRPLGLQGKLAAGATTGVLKTLMFYPLELARTRLASDTAARGQPRVYRGLTHCLLQTYRRESLAGLYKGVGLSTVGIVPYLAISFAAYDELKSALPDTRTARASWWFPLAKIGAGAAAGVAAQAATFPLDTVRRRMQVSGGLGTQVTYRGYWDCISSMAMREGPASFYRGLGVNIMKTVPGAAIQFVTYDALKSAAMRVAYSHDSSMW